MYVRMQQKPSNHTHKYVALVLFYYICICIYVHQWYIQIP